MKTAAVLRGARASKVKIDFALTMPCHDIDMVTLSLRAPYSHDMANLIVGQDKRRPLCRREIALVRRHYRRGAIHFIDAVTGRHAACPIKRGDVLGRFHNRKDGMVVPSVAALGSMRWTIWLLRLVGLEGAFALVLAALESFCRSLQRVRPQLQRLAAQVQSV